MKAFPGGQKQKDELLAQLQAHYDADEIAKGKYWYNGKGCAIGCILHSGNHKEIEKYGIPEVIAHLVDRIFEGLPNEDAKNFTIEWVKAIEVGADLSFVWPKFAVWLLIDPDHGVIRFNDHEAIKTVAGLYTKLIDGLVLDQKDWEAAKAAARSAKAAAMAADAAYWDDESARDTARAADAADAADAAARAAGAYLHEYYDYCSARSEDSSLSAAWAARPESGDIEDSFKTQKDKLIELLKMC